MNSFYFERDDIESYLFENDIKKLNMRLKKKDRFCNGDFKIIEDIVKAAIGFEKGIYVHCEYIKPSDSFSIMLDTLRINNDYTMEEYSEMLIQAIQCLENNDFSKSDIVEKFITKIQAYITESKNNSFFYKERLYDEYACFK